MKVWQQRVWEEGGVVQMHQVGAGRTLRVHRAGRMVRAKQMRVALGPIAAAVTVSRGPGPWAALRWLLSASLSPGHREGAAALATECPSSDLFLEEQPRKVPSSGPRNNPVNTHL